MSQPYKNITQHVITVMVEDKPGVLARISSMFARRGFNIHSLAVGPTVDPQLSRMTVVADGPEMEQIIKQLYKLVNTVKVTEHRPGLAVEREIMLVRINADSKRRGVDRASERCRRGVTAARRRLRRWWTRASSAFSSPQTSSRPT